MLYSDLSKFHLHHVLLDEESKIVFFIECCERYAEKGGRHADNYFGIRIRDMLKRGRIDQGVLYLYYEKDVVAFTGLESYKGKEALMVTRACVYNPSPVPYSTFFLLPKVLEIAKQKGFKHAGGSVNSENRLLVKLMSSGEKTFNNTPFEKYKHLVKDCFNNLVIGEKQMYNGVEQQFYFITV